MEVHVKVHQLQQLLNEAMPDDEVEMLFIWPESGRVTQVFPSEIQRGVFTRISEADKEGQPYESPLVVRSPATCRIILES